MQIVTKRMDEIRPYEKNPRKNDEAVKFVAESIKQFGFKVPIVIDNDGVIVAGHTRFKAAKKLGLSEVPCIIADDLTEEQIKAFRLADNKVSEKAEWDFDLLSTELDAIIDIDMMDFGFGTDNDWFESGDKGYAREGEDEYAEFLDKFEEKHTTDDCYTPKIVYDAVAEYVEERYGIKNEKFVRPFYPGGDYKNEKYKKGDVVVDNPPFSILSQIIQWYTENEIPFFLFGPGTTIFSSSCAANATCICAGPSIIYENGAIVCTSFVTNMEAGIRCRTDAKLYKMIDEANKKNQEANKRSLTKNEYPDHVITAAFLNKMSKYGVDLTITKEESELIRELDEQKEAGNAIFGSGFLISDRLAAEKAAAEKWKLSERELEIVKQLNKRSK